MVVADTFDIAAVKKHISEANKTYGERFRTNDLNWYNERYCSNACSNPPNMPAVCGTKAIMEFSYGTGEYKDYQIIITETEVYGTADAVIEEGVYSFPDGQGGSFDKGKFIAIWKQENDKWKLYREIWNSDVPVEPVKQQ